MGKFESKSQLPVHAFSAFQSGRFKFTLFLVEFYPKRFTDKL